jgi:UTP--glucose-1-phosphate uridylyltransferase
MKKIRKAVIPAAGMGTRFFPATRVVPKEMLPVIDTPMIQYVIEEAVASGIEDVILVVSTQKESIQRYFSYQLGFEAWMQQAGKDFLAEKSRQLGEMCNLILVHQKEPLGLGHAVWCARPVIGDEPFAVLLGDEIMTGAVPVTQQLAHQFEEAGASVIGLHEVPDEEVSRYGIATGFWPHPDLMRIERMVEKPRPEDTPSRWAIPGRYVLSDAIFRCLEETKPGKGGEIQLTDAMQMLLRQEPFFGFKFKGVRHDTGDKLGWLRTNLLFALERPELREGVQALIQDLAQDGTGQRVGL